MKLLRWQEGFDAEGNRTERIRICVDDASLIQFVGSLLQGYDIRTRKAERPPVPETLCNLGESRVISGAVKRLAPVGSPVGRIQQWFQRIGKVFPLFRCEGWLHYGLRHSDNITL